MSDTAELKALLVRVEEAEGADRSLDGRIAFWQGWGPHFDLDPSSSAFDDWPHLGGHWTAPEETDQSNPLKCSCLFASDAYPPHYSASIDAALALTEHVLPGWYGLVEFYQHETKAKLIVDKVSTLPSGHKKTSPIVGAGVAPTRPLAIVIALLRTKIAEAESGG